MQCSQVAQSLKVEIFLPVQSQGTEDAEGLDLLVTWNFGWFPHLSNFLQELDLGACFPKFAKQVVDSSSTLHFVFSTVI